MSEFSAPQREDRSAELPDHIVGIAGFNAEAIQGPDIRRSKGRIVPRDKLLSLGWRLTPRQRRLNDAREECEAENEAAPL